MSVLHLIVALRTCTEGFHYALEKISNRYLQPPVYNASILYIIIKLQTCSFMTMQILQKLQTLL